MAFDQVDALGELHVRWTGSDDGELSVSDEFDEPMPAEGTIDLTDVPMSRTEEERP